MKRGNWALGWSGQLGCVGLNIDQSGVIMKTIGEMDQGQKIKYRLEQVTQE